VQRLAAFRGPVSCRRAAEGPLRLTLEGRAEGHAEGNAGEPLAVAFAGDAPADLPEALSDVLIERTAPGEYRIASPAGDWRLAAASVHLHRDVRAPFFAALPPRPAPLSRRLGYRLLVALAASRTAIALLRALRR
jgi:hypothetical protein